MNNATTAAQAAQPAVKIGSQEQKALTFPMPETARPYLVAIGKFEDAADAFSDAINAHYSRQCGSEEDKDCDKVFNLVFEAKAVIEEYLFDAFFLAFWTNDEKGGADNE